MSCFIQFFRVHAIVHHCEKKPVQVTVGVTDSEREPLIDKTNYKTPTYGRDRQT